MKNKAPPLPEEYKGNTTGKPWYAKTTPRQWTDQEIIFMKNLITQGYTTKQISESLQRSEVSVALKRKRLSKKNKTYNNNHITQKRKANKKFLEYLKPKRICDAYNGGSNQYQQYGAYTNDINKNVDCMYHQDALKFMYLMYINDERFDLIDLDPFGSCYPCIDVAMKLLKTTTSTRGGGDFA